MSKSELEIAIIQPSTDPFRASWLECSNCHKELFEQNNLPKIIPTVCPKCLSLLELSSNLKLIPNETHVQNHLEKFVQTQPTQFIIGQNKPSSFFSQNKQNNKH